MEDFLNQLLINFDISELSNLDWADILTYSVILLTAGGSVYAASKTFLYQIWKQLEPPIGFLISSLVVFSLWYAILRVHVSVSFNLDKEAFDNLLWLSALTFTPYYLARYHLIEQTFIFAIRTIELIVDIVFWSWFEEIAKGNRQKWYKRTANWQRDIHNAFQNFIPSISLRSEEDHG